METDIPLKALTATCAADLLPLLGSPDATVLGVETLELPAMATRLDNILHLRSPGGADYLHLIEWQGYRDARFLSRALYYRAWLGLERPLPILATLIYLKPGDDTGDTLRHTLDGRDVFVVPFHCVRLWEQDAARWRCPTAPRRPSSTACGSGSRMRRQPWRADVRAWRRSRRSCEGRTRPWWSRPRR